MQRSCGSYQEDRDIQSATYSHIVFAEIQE